jgi:RNA-directed DNA polymerase
LEEEEERRLARGLATPEKIRNLQKKLYDKAKSEPDFRFYLLYDKVYRADILEHAYRLRRSQGGAAGVDGVTFESIEAAGAEDWLRSIATELREGSYEPQPVRRVMIPKASGGERPLGIPTVRDRVVQTAAMLVLEPIFEADFEDNAYGYRPKRSAQGAVQDVLTSLKRGQNHVVDADLSKYFDTIPHRELMQSVARRISDRKMLHLIKMWLKAPVEETDERGRKVRTGSKNVGTPQGGVISPLLANIYIHRLLRAWIKFDLQRLLGSRIINYADDLVIVCRTAMGAQSAHAWLRKIVEKLGLRLNETKTCVRHAWTEACDFLGYTFGPVNCPRTGGKYISVQPTKKAIERVKQNVKSVLSPRNQDALPEVIVRLNRSLNGWANYFSIGTLSKAYRAVDNYLYAQLRRFLGRRHKVPTRGTLRFSYRFLKQNNIVVLQDRRRRRSSHAFT